MQTNADMLAEVPLFAHLSDEGRAVLAARLDVINLAEGTTMFQHGDPGDALYVVKSGEVELYFKNDTGERITLEVVGPGQFFGDISLLDGGSRTSSALVMKTLEALVVDRGDLEALISTSPRAALHILAATGERMRNTVMMLRRMRNPQTLMQNRMALNPR